MGCSPNRHRCAGSSASCRLLASSGVPLSPECNPADAVTLGPTTTAALIQTPPPTRVRVHRLPDYPRDASSPPYVPLRWIVESPREPMDGHGVRSPSRAQRMFRRPEVDADSEYGIGSVLGGNASAAADPVRRGTLLVARL